MDKKEKQAPAKEEKKAAPILGYNPLEGDT